MVHRYIHSIGRDKGGKEVGDIVLSDEDEDEDSFIFNLGVIGQMYGID